jgi:hypothetical protein
MTKYVKVAALAYTLLIAGCAMDKYQAAAPHFTGPAGAAAGAGVVVLLEPVFPGKPFSETVCDNAVGVSWSPDESHHIGFTQHYGNTLAKNGPQLAMLAALPANQRIGMSASGSAQPINIDSRILVPFGRFIHDNLAQAVGADGQVCENEECAHEAMQARPTARLVTVRFTTFRVLEQQRNMLMLEVDGTATVRRADATTTSIPIHNVVNRSITSEGLWHSDFLKAMNHIANDSTSAVAAQILGAGR